MCVRRKAMLEANLRDSLRRARSEAGISQTALAKRLGKPQSFVSKFEKGQRRLDVIEFCEVASAIGVEPLEILTASGVIGSGKKRNKRSVMVRSKGPDDRRVP